VIQQDLPDIPGGLSPTVISFTPPPTSTIFTSQTTSTLGPPSPSSHKSAWKILAIVFTVVIACGILAAFILYHHVHRNHKLKAEAIQGTGANNEEVESTTGAASLALGPEHDSKYVFALSELSVRILQCYIFILF
jgi:hypothetical protein